MAATSRLDPVIFDRFMESDGETSDSDTSGDEMSGPAPKKIKQEDGTAFTTDTIKEMSTEILDECFYNIVHDIVLEVHREEKIARMKSAATIAEQKAKRNTALARANESEQPNGDRKTTESDPSSPRTLYVRTETEGAIVEPEGKIHLKGNPLKTTPTIYCPQCKLPRLLYPTAGFGARDPPDPTIEYCAHRPFISKSGHDVHGNPFATDKVSNRGKNSKKKQQEEKEKENLASSPSTEPSTPVNGSFKSSNGTETPAKVAYPPLKCPNCPRYLISNRIAQHLNTCIGNGRQSSRNAMTKMSTPQDSRAGTPKPSSQVLKRKKGDEESANRSGSNGDSPPKKKAKPAVTKKAGNNKPAAGSKLKNGETVAKGAAGKTTAAKITGKKQVGRPPGTGKKGPAAAKAADPLFDDETGNGAGTEQGEDSQIRDGRE